MRIRVYRAPGGRVNEYSDHDGEVADASNESEYVITDGIAWPSGGKQVCPVAPRMGNSVRNASS